MKKFYLVNVVKVGGYIEHPDVGHKNYKNAGYNVDMTNCIWVADEAIDMAVGGVTEITQAEADEYLSTWKSEREALKDDTTN
jgi:hypothetical protein